MYRESFAWSTLELVRIEHFAAMVTRSHISHVLTENAWVECFKVWNIYNNEEKEWQIERKQSATRLVDQYLS